VLTKGKAMKKINIQLPPGSLNAHLLRSSFYGSKIKDFEYKKGKLQMSFIPNITSRIRGVI
jgi:hypothetical protein